MSLPTVPTEQSLIDWLTTRVGAYLRRDPAELDPTVPLAEYGLDSVAALSLCGDVEDHFGIPVDPTAAWDFPTVRALAGHLWKELENAG